ncbi:hypothetical protein J2D73_18480 [Acetobacter sacchari]|uniref:Uncharacterized protein n=1 Tax=Acetobacter sacchari TaxID=2661687 RepID=A0ABS3M0R3_9PROT|nr:hypothetical protein [Acetobacter sacchari]MBO1361772.1 hypothetical protein [Acetobacter sacchari]
MSAICACYPRGVKPPYFETDDEFDDGGTPMWRERQQELRRTHVRQRVTINAPARRQPQTLREWWDMATPAQIFITGQVLFWSFLFVVVIGTVAALVIHDAIFGAPSDFDAAMWQTSH